MSKTIVNNPCLYSDREELGMSFDVPTVTNKAIGVSGFFTRKSNGFAAKQDKPAKGKHFNPADPDTVVYVAFQVEDQNDYWTISLGRLNKSDSFKEMITVDGNQFTLADDARITANGDEFSFHK